MSWTERATSSHKLQLFTTALVSGTVAAIAVLGYQEGRRQLKLRQIRAEIPDVDPDATPLTEYGAAVDVSNPSKEDKRSAALALRARMGDYDDALILEQLARNRVFLTDPGLKTLRNSFIIIVGLGGVGSHACAALARSGVSKIRIVDFDQVTLSSLNRHSVATLADVGTPKVHALRRRLEQVVPWVHWDCRNELFSDKVAEKQLAPWSLDGEFKGQKPDFVIDAIDNIDSKVALLHYCHTHSIPVISSMGAGCKSDPTRVFLGDISASAEDPLSRATRRRLRLLGVSSGIPTVFSTEKTAPGKAQLLPLPDEEFQKGKVGELGVLPDFRVRILPVLGTMPAVFGLVVANHVILKLTGYPHDYLPSKGREKMYEGILGNVQAMEEKLARVAGSDPVGVRVPLTQNDVGYLVEEVWRGKSVVSGLATRLTLVRWRRPEGSVLDTSVEGQKCSTLKMGDLICMTKEEAVRHEKEVLKGEKQPEDVYDGQVIKLVAVRMEEEKEFEKFR
ncbi:hypothetical protein K402DRAFT_392243 [Aulographum hederae CBS 113979]|uniref:THIF-type NAD/FAD binding fold domain-containing protein n=1 Tax=Aulographum hederae CBS 113979 TaxID=1176131 RepID=A0A6G1H4I0_9PEZI|nr:hypothetical protein K402DRAFT_392243 [Aulographum hederae CBS 113979]